MKNSTKLKAGLLLTSLACAAGATAALVLLQKKREEEVYHEAELKAMDELENAKGADPEYVPLPKFPSVARDIAVVCDASIPVATLENCISRGARGLLKEVELFDIYTGAPIPAGKKSVAFNLTLRSDERSLTAAEADEDVKSVLELLQKELGAVLR